ncbi:L,D-transpeptidase family protein [Clostridium estertheticum]|uniref:L,D-transpeptidase family protein n=1 Tax=Clostridium estertheticum TaxID=238834 RepID=UPI0013E92D45|nr:L,D-transpeptidase family protein [Clostridium estertheticum]MBZ9686215.1 L,D-transpeptidase family protein [Clostridium estertheticum]
MKTHKITKELLFFVMILIFLIPIKAFGAEEKKMQEVNKDKIWSINFNDSVLLDEISKESIYILDDMEKKVDITLELSNDGKTILVKPPKQGYEPGKNYVLQINNQIHNAAGETIIGPISFKFTIERPVYIVKVNNINLSVKQGQAFTLQEKVTVDLSNGGRVDKGVLWNTTNVDTTKAGTYTFEGNVEGYDDKVSLTLNIIIDYNYLVKPSIVVAELTWDSYFYNDMSLYSQRLGIAKKGSKVEIIVDKSFEWYYIRTKEGKYGWLKRNTLIIPKDPETNTKKLTKMELEGYVNLMKFNSSTVYFIWVDISHQNVNVFQGTKGNYKLLKTMSCATGKNISPTIRGSFTIQDRGPWFYTGKSGARYWVRFSGAYLFHSIAMDANKNVKDYTLGKRASEGCVRLSIIDSKWVYDNMPYGTNVWVN